MKYFDMSEFTCNCCGELPEEGMNPELLEALDELRERWGRPIYVSCGYRCPQHNAEVGGVPNSQHVYGNAADIYVDGGFQEYQDFYNLVIDSELFDAIGYYPDEEFVHVDQRCDGCTPNYYRW